MQVIFSKIELEISPFLTIIQFYSSIIEKRVGKSGLKKFQREQDSETYLLTLKEQNKTKMKLSLGMVSKHVFWYPYLPDYKRGIMMASKHVWGYVYIRYVTRMNISFLDLLLALGTKIRILVQVS